MPLTAKKISPALTSLESAQRRGAFFEEIRFKSSSKVINFYCKEFLLILSAKVDIAMENCIFMLILAIKDGF